MKRILFQLAVISVTVAASAAPPVCLIVETKTNFLIGGWANGQWLDSVTAHKKVRGGENYTLFDGLKPVGVAKGSKATPYGSPCDKTYLVKFKTLPYKPKGLLARRLGPPFFVGVSGAGMPQNKKLMPRFVQDESSSSTHRAFVVQWLKARGVGQPQVGNLKIWRADLEGDGKSEIIINALRHAYQTGAPQNMVADARAGDYSLLFVRRMVGKKWQTVAIENQIYAKAKNLAVPSVLELANVLDVNGDGKMEIICRGRYYQGDWMAVYEWRSGMPKRVITTACGV